MKSRIHVMIGIILLQLVLVNSRLLALEYNILPVDKNYLNLEVKNDSESMVYASIGVFKRTYPAGTEIYFRYLKPKDSVLFNGREVRASLDTISASLNVNTSGRLLEVAPHTKIVRSMEKRYLIALAIGSLREFHKGNPSFWDSLEKLIASGEVEFRLCFPVSNNGEALRAVESLWFLINQIEGRD
jgi:hypothetical protein